MNSTRSHSRHVALAGLALAALFVTGCGGSDSEPEATPQSIDTSVPDATETSEAPPPDNGGGGTSVTLPSAPVGGQSEASNDDPAVQCLSVNWLAGDDATIPDGGSVALGDFSFDPAVLTVADSGCEDQGQHCSGFAFTSSDLSCSLPLRWNGTEFSAEVTEASATVPAVASCDTDSSECASFLDAVDDQSPSQLSVTLPPVDDTSDDGATDGSESSDG